MIQSELERLQVIVDKTADARERIAFDLVSTYVENQTGPK
jgi:hypothetical protein